MTATMKHEWLTRTEVADYLRCSTDTVDRMLIRSTEPKQPGKLRYSIGLIGTVKRVRIVAADVYASLPLVEEVVAG